jgi:hypothetical protein
MKSKQWIWLLLALILAQCQVPPQSTPSVTKEPLQPTPSVTQAPSAIHFLLESSGTVRIKRFGWSDYIPVSYGTALRTDDLLQVQGKASVLCSDLSLSETSGIGSTPCKTTNPIAFSDGMEYSTFRAKKIVPYILYPRKTLILTAHPLLRWNDTLSKHYKVSILSNDQEVWSGVSSVTQMQYPTTAPDLKPEVSYHLRVTDLDENKSSEEDPATGLNFRLVDPILVKKIDAETSQMFSSQAFSEVDRKFALAIYYLAFTDPNQNDKLRLFGEAWPLLEEVSKIQPSPAILLKIGDTLAGMALSREAQSAYQFALQYAQSLGDLESQAEAHADLWRVNGNQDDFEQAVNFYKQLGDSNQVN